MGATSLEIIDALRRVHDPCCAERGISVVDMGLVRSVSVEGGRAHVELMLTSGWCPFASKVIGSVKETVEELPHVDRAEVEVTWEEAWTIDRMSDDARAKLVFLPEPVAVANRDDYIAAHNATTTRGDRQ
ncbi:MAG TPA: metal-sulfur cluster assembly factor [Actinomycetota bacterium]|nr:metal-sulfur cluster assembly factor [Actinomycetota bacterium]